MLRPLLVGRTLLLLLRTREPQGSLLGVPVAHLRSSTEARFIGPQMPFFKAIPRRLGIRVYDQEGFVGQISLPPPPPPPQLRASP